MAALAEEDIMKMRLLFDGDGQGKGASKKINS